MLCGWGRCSIKTQRYDPEDFRGSGRIVLFFSLYYTTGSSLLNLLSYFGTITASFLGASSDIISIRRFVCGIADARQEGTALSIVVVSFCFPVKLLLTYKKRDTLVTWD